MKTRKIIISITIPLVLLMSNPAHAGPYANDLAKCLVSSTSAKDRSSLVEWLFEAASSHPALKSIASVTPAQLEAANKTIATLFVRLLTKSCLKETQNAVKYEGKSTIQRGFQVLGQVAGRELFSDPSVTKNMSGLMKYIDKQKIDKVLGSSAKH